MEIVSLGHYEYYEVPVICNL